MNDLLTILILLIILLVNFFLLCSFLGFFVSSSAGAPFVPTGKKIARKMIELANVQPGEKVFDLGCGDGRLVFLAAEKGANATGIEISYPIFLWAKWLRKTGKKDGTLLHGSMWKTDVSNADVIFTYLFPKMMARFDREIYPTLKKGCRIITHGFALKDRVPELTWRPEGKKRGKILVYVKQ